MTCECVTSRHKPKTVHHTAFVHALQLTVLTGLARRRILRKTRRLNVSSCIDASHSHSHSHKRFTRQGRFRTGAVELQLGGGAPPCVSEGLLGFLIEAVVVKAAQCTQTEGNRGRVVRLQRAVGSVNGRICEEGALLCSTCSVRERREKAHRGLHHTSAEDANANASDVHKQSRIARTTNVNVGPIRPKFAQV